MDNQDFVDFYLDELIILNQYDEGRLPVFGPDKVRLELSLDKALSIIRITKEKLMEKGEASELFGQESSTGVFKGILSSVYQTYDGIELYNSNRKKAANLLYMIIKDHPFVDGNKRIGSIIFLNFVINNLLVPRGLSREDNIEQLKSLLVPVALFLASSNPKDKDNVIELIENLIWQLGVLVDIFIWKYILR